MGDNLKQIKDSKFIVPSDLHIGGSTAIFPPKITLPPLMANEKQRVYTADPHQLSIFNHMMKQARRIKKESIGKQKVIVFNADLIEGLHHNTIQLKLPMVSDMVTVAIDVIETFLQEVGFSVKNGDELYFGSGTESHVGYSEVNIAKHFSHLGAEYYDELKLKKHGKNIWFTHQWVGVGKGHNEGNALYNALKSLYYDCLKEGKQMPDLAIGSHFHKAGLGSYTQKFKTYYGLITPSLQMKTRFGQKVSAFERNDVGFIEFDLTKDGLFKFYEPELLKERLLYSE